MKQKNVDRSPWWLALAAAVGVIGGALVTGGFNYLSHQSEVDAKMIELSVGILRSSPTPETEPLREWAIDVIDKRARFSFNAKQRAVLLKRQLPFTKTFEFLDGADRDNWIDIFHKELHQPLPSEKKMNDRLTRVQRSLGRRPFATTCIIGRHDQSLSKHMA